MTDKIDLVCKTLVEPDERPVREVAMGVEFFGTCRVKIRPQALKGSQTRTVFHDDGLVIFGESVIEEIR
jgi:hypothetical protein